MNSPNQLIDSLIEHQVITKNHADLARSFSDTDHTRSFILRLIDLQLVDEDRLADHLAKHLRLPRFAFEHTIAPEKFEIFKLEREFFISHKMIPLDISGVTVSIAAVDPIDTRALSALTFSIGLSPKLLVATSRELATLADLVIPNKAPVGLADASKNLNSSHVQRIEELEWNAPVITFVDQLIEDGLKRMASDIHIEARENGALLRYRIDGLLSDVAPHIHAPHEAIVARIKILSKLDIAERRQPQDGRFSIRTQGDLIDVRVSVIPTIYGENVVLRLLKKDQDLLNFEKLGFGAPAIQNITHALSKSYGIILVTGPTGSGKTTTLYTALSTLNAPERKILTVEDPIEYSLDGINQVQIDHRINRSFATMLRAFLRQDPDVIMVGEIRDRETAAISIEAAMTGHLVLSTLHTNNASTAIIRLLDMGIPNYLIASTLSLVLGQRLVRLLCPKCKKRHHNAHLTFERSAKLYSTFKMAEVYQPSQCSYCNMSGFIGRSCLSEALVMSDNMRHQIINDPTAHTIEKLACQEGMTTLFENGLDLVLSGQLSLAELTRVTSE